MALVNAWQWAKRLPVLYVVTITYLLLIGNAVLCFRQLGAHMTEPIQEVFLLSTVGFSMAAMFMFAIGSVALSALYCEKILKVLLVAYGAIGSVLYCTTKWKIIPHASSNATVMALALPYLFPFGKDWKKIFIALTILVAIIDSNTSSPIGVASVVIATYLILTKHYKYLVLAGVPLAIGVAVYGAGYLFDDTLRFRAYRAFMGYWWRDSWDINLFGYGPGSFEILSQIIQEKISFLLQRQENGRLRGELFMHMHSDLLQFVWEYGLIGAALIYASMIKLWLSFKGLVNEQVVLMGCYSAMIFDFPFRYPGVPVVLALLFAIMIRRQNATGT